MDPTDPTFFLSQLGFSETEALVYCELLKQPGRTGYAIAKTIKKSQANVYSALEGLTAKGAVDFSNSEVRSYQAVPPGELLQRLSKEFQQKCKAAEAALSKLSRSVADDRVYQLKNQDQVYERAEAMCARAGETIAFVLFPLPFARLKRALEAAVRAGASVAGVTFSPEDVIEGAKCVLSAKFGRKSAWPYASNWPRDHMLLVRDGKEALVALFDRNTHQVLHGLYTDSVYLSLLFHASVVDGITVNLARPDIMKKSVTKEIFDTLPSGFTELLGR